MNSGSDGTSDRVAPIVTILRISVRDLADLDNSAQKGTGAFTGRSIRARFGCVLVSPFSIQ